MIAALVLYPLAVWQLGGRAITRTIRHLTKENHPA